MENKTIKSLTVDIPVRVTMTSVYDAPFEFTSSIDDAGQIILTPTSKDVEFIEANTDGNVDYDIPIAEQETTIKQDGNLTTRSTSIMLHANMIAENENTEVSADVDEIGQCVIWPSSKENTFVSATIADSLNLITEELQVLDYFGYKLINSGDGWDIKDYLGETIEEGVATEAEAKIVVLTTELHRVEELSEEVETKPAQPAEQTNNNDAEDEDKQIPGVEAEVLSERVDNVDPVETFDVDQIMQILSQITNQFTDVSGGISCDTLEEKAACVKILQLHYSKIDIEQKDPKILIYFSDLIKNKDIVEELSPSDDEEFEEAAEEDGRQN